MVSGEGVHVHVLQWWCWCQKCRHVHISWELGSGAWGFEAFCGDSGWGREVQQQRGPWNDRVWWWLRPMGRVQSISSMALVILDKAPA